MLRGSAWQRTGLVALAAVVASLVSTAPALATWQGTLLRNSTDPSSGSLLLDAHANASFGLHFGLNLPGYTVSNVTASQPGPDGEPACTPTSNSDLTTHNAGFDCTFGQPVSQVTVTFTTSPRYPDNGGGETWDDDDSTNATVAGPPPATIVPREPTEPDLKQEALQYARNEYTEALADCLAASPYDQIVSEALVAVVRDRQQECEQGAMTVYELRVVNLDPVDQNFSAVALPGASPAPTLGRTRCGRAHTRLPAAACRRLAALELSRLQEAARSAALWGAVYTTLNRLGTAKSDGSSAGVATQTAALQAYDGEILAEGAAEDATDAALASALHKLRLDFRLSAKQVAADQRSLNRGRLPAAVLHALAAHGISAKKFAAAMNGVGAARPGPLDFLGALRARHLNGPAVAKVRADWRALTGQDLTAIVDGLASAHAVNQSLQQRLDNDANQIDQASAGSARRSAAEQFVQDAAQAHGEAASLLEAAGNALT